MAKAGRQTTKKHARRPRRELRFALEEVFPKDKADALRQWLAHEKTVVAAAREKNKQLDAGRREIDHYLAIRDNQIRPPWAVALPPRPSSKKRRKKHAGGRGRDWDYAGIKKLTKNYIKTHGLPRTAALLIEKVDDACKVAGISFDDNKTQCKSIIRSVYQLARKRLEQKTVGN